MKPKAFAAKEGRKKNFKPEAQADTFIISKEAASCLKKIGQPAESPFVPDPFQSEAAALIETDDVIVSAPTGSGKTWIAQEAMSRELARGGQSWYASPLKALSNAKYLEFSRKFGAETVGLLTGDLRFNTSAPIIIGTTEILRNQLYDAMSQSLGGTVNCDLVILDEAHYLGDRDRGVVWEEVLIYLPPRVRILLLSATIDNARELADWLTDIRGRPAKVVSGGQRPVPLVSLYYGHKRLLTLDQLMKKADRNKRDFAQLGTAPVLGALKSLDELSLTPAIFFQTSRRQCDQCAESVPPTLQENSERRAGRLALIDGYVAKYPFLGRHRHLKLLKNSAVASHHAGHLPIYKMLVEELMSKGLLSAIFATSTVSAGVNFPARTVVLDQSDRFDGRNFSPITSTELAQMTGRAGRRGRDNIGFAVLLPGRFMKLTHLDTLFSSPPEPIISQLNLEFTMVLNLVGAFELKEIRSLLNKSLAAWQLAEEKTPEGLNRAANGIWKLFQEIFAFLRKVGLIDEHNRLTEWGELAARLRLDHPLVICEAIRQKALPADDPALLAGVMAGYLEEKRGNVFQPAMPQELRAALKSVRLAVRPMQKLLSGAGFGIPSQDQTEAAAVWAWAEGRKFRHVSRLYGQDEGDAVRLILRTAEHLNQLRDLPGQPELGANASIARKLLLKPPVI
jgi:superfamily II RNA helicase